MKKKFIVCTHGKFGEELVKSAEMINGQMEDVIAISLLEGMGPEEYTELLENEIKNSDKDVICLVDLFGGTPCMMAMKLSENYDHYIISGVNLGMILEMYTLREVFDSKELLEHGLKSLVESGKNVSEMLGR